MSGWEVIGGIVMLAALVCGLFAGGMWAVQVLSRLSGNTEAVLVVQCAVVLVLAAAVADRGNTAVADVGFLVFVLTGLFGGGLVAAGNARVAGVVVPGLVLSVAGLTSAAEVLLLMAAAGWLVLSVLSILGRLVW